MNASLIIFFLFFSVGLVEIILALPLMHEKIPPNRFYGFRVGKTLSQEDVWYKVNKYGGRDLFLAGVILSGGSLAILFLQFDVFIGFVYGFLLVMIPLVILVGRSFLYLRKL